jgi:thiosulfate/3-mercaptopyruvate sulfurtransferase
MLTFVSTNWVAERLDSPDIQILDPRSVLRYMAGHLKNAINISVAKARDANSHIGSAGDLARWLGSCGVDDRRTPVLYDNSDGRSAALLAWLLAYLGRDDIHVMNVFIENWIAERREIFYRPIKAAPQNFTARVRPGLRRTLAQVQSDSQNHAAAKLIDFRSRDEFTGKVDHDNRPGHIPGAVNIVWQDFAGSNGDILASQNRIEQLLAAQGIAAQDQVVAYCRTGLRAALGFLALAQLGRNVSLYDGSYAEWAASGSPVEADETVKNENEAKAAS